MDRDRGSARSRASGDAGGIVLGWLTKLVVVLAVVGVALFDVLSIATSRLAVEDHAALAAREASQAYLGSGDVQVAYAEAVSAAADANPLDEVPPERFSTAKDGTVTLAVRREATTFVVHRIPWIADWAVVSGDATAKSLG
ncbi:MAG TPA: hypothetical protein VFD41_15220 [Actinomycetales bacterium]|nr:hypothetical protein [Actinomycetales bacterium]